jgi:hypothetical protein
MKKPTISVKHRLQPAIFTLMLILSTVMLLLHSSGVTNAALSRANSTTCSNAGATTVSCTVTTPTNGNALIAVVGVRDSATVSSISQTGATWVLARRSTNTTTSVEIWYALNVSGAGTGVTVNLSASAKASAVIGEYADVELTGAFDVSAINSGTGTTVTSGTTATTAIANQVWIGGFVNINTSTYASPTNSFTQVGQVSSTGGGPTTRSNAVMYERIVSTTGTASVGATLSASQEWAGVVATFSGQAVPTKVVFTTANRTVTAGVCNGAGSVITMQVQDAANNPIAPDSSTVVRVTSTSPDYTIYSDSSCTTTVTNGDFSFNGSENSKNIYIIDRRKSNPTWTLTLAQQAGGDTLTGDTQTITTNAGSTARLVITLPGQTFTDGVGNSGSPSNRTAGQSFNITQIAATDTFFNVTTGYSGSRTLAYSGPANAPDSTPPSYTTAVSFTNGLSTTTLATTLYRAEINDNHRNRWWTIWVCIRIRDRRSGTTG